MIAPSWPELCEEAARAFGAFVSGGRAGDDESSEVELVTLTGVDRDELWVRWWRALLRVAHVEGRLIVSATVEAPAGVTELRARPRAIALASLDPSRCVDIKAVTWHDAHVERDGDTLRGRIVLDV